MSRNLRCKRPALVGAALMDRFGYAAPSILYILFVSSSGVVPVSFVDTGVWQLCVPTNAQATAVAGKQRRLLLLRISSSFIFLVSASDRGHKWRDLVLSQTPHEKETSPWTVTLFSMISGEMAPTLGYTPLVAFRFVAFYNSQSAGLSFPTT